MLEVKCKFLQLIDVTEAKSKTGNSYLRAKLICEKVQDKKKRLMCFDVFGTTKVNSLKSYMKGDRMSITYICESKQGATDKNRWFTYLDLKNFERYSPASKQATVDYGSLDHIDGFSQGTGKLM